MDVYLHSNCTFLLQVTLQNLLFRHFPTHLQAFESSNFLGAPGGVLFIEPSNPPLRGGPKIAHSIEDSIGTIEAQIGCGVYCVRLVSRTRKIEIFFLKKPDSIYFQPQTVIYATTNYYYHHQKCLPPNNPALCPLLNPSFIVQCPRPVQKCSTTTSNICAKNTTHSPLSKRTRFANMPIRTSFPLTMP